VPGRFRGHSWQIGGRLDHARKRNKISKAAVQEALRQEGIDGEADLAM
jgi:hypothetical protein